MLKLYQSFDNEKEYFFHPYPKSFEKLSNTEDEYCQSYFIGIKLNLNNI